MKRRQLLKHLGAAIPDGPAMAPGADLVAWNVSFGKTFKGGDELLTFHRIAHGYYNLYWRVG